MKSHFFTVFASLCFLTLDGLTLLADDKDEARDFMESTLNQLVEVVQSDLLTPDAKRAITERQIREHLALGNMAIESLGALAARFNLEEFADFSREFEYNLLYFYLDRAATYRGNGIEIIDTISISESSEYVVKTLGGERGSLFTRTAPERAKVDYHLRKIDDRWQITLIVINGVDVSANFRAQFKSVLERKSPSAIIRQLRQSNAKKEKTNPFD